MTDIAGTGSIDVAGSSKPSLSQPLNPLTLILFFGVMAAGFLFVAYSLCADVGATGVETKTYLPFLLLFVALVIALGFEFVNGFHDTANAVKIAVAVALGLGSTTHVLSSGIAGTMAANGSGLQWRTIVNIILGWVLTLPVAIVLSATLYWAFSHVF